jgi:ribulose-phosphate 3-epimerase
MKRTDILLNGEKPLISPSLLAADFSKLSSELERVAEADALHLDIMDGHFVPNISYGPAIVSQLRPYWDKVFDVHLMVSEPERWVDPFAKAGADILAFHWEATHHAHRLIQNIHEQGILAGVSLNPGTPVQVLEPLLPFLDLVLIMTVNPGFGGQAYIAEMEAKLKWLRQKREETNGKWLIQIDGGVSDKNIASASRAGADFFVAGTSIFKAESPENMIRRLRELGREA